MLTEKDTKAGAAHAPRPAHAPTDAANPICYFEGKFVPLSEAKVSIMTHAFMYGTATFEGIRAYWNEDQQRLYGLKMREHVERIRQSCRILLMDDIPSVDELIGLIVETVRRNGFHSDAYIRPSFYKSTRAIGVRLHELAHELRDAIETDLGDAEVLIHVEPESSRRDPAESPSAFRAG